MYDYENNQIGEEEINLPEDNYNDSYKEYHSFYKTAKINHPTYIMNSNESYHNKSTRKIYNNSFQNKKFNSIIPHHHHHIYHIHHCKTPCHSHSASKSKSRSCSNSASPLKNYSQPLMYTNYNIQNESSYQSKFRYINDNDIINNSSTNFHYDDINKTKNYSHNIYTEKIQEIENDKNNNSFLHNTGEINHINAKAFDDYMSKLAMNKYNKIKQFNESYYFKKKYGEDSKNNNNSNIRYNNNIIDNNLEELKNMRRNLEEKYKLYNLITKYDEIKFNNDNSNENLNNENNNENINNKNSNENINKEDYNEIINNKDINENINKKDNNENINKKDNNENINKEDYNENINKEDYNENINKEEYNKNKKDNNDNINDKKYKKIINQKNKENYRENNSNNINSQNYHEYNREVNINKKKFNIDENINDIEFIKKNFHNKHIYEGKNKYHNYSENRDINIRKKNNYKYDKNNISYSPQSQSQSDSSPEKVNYKNDFIKDDNNRNKIQKTFNESIGQNNNNYISSAYNHYKKKSQNDPNINYNESNFDNSNLIDYLKKENEELKKLNNSYKQILDTLFYFLNNISNKNPKENENSQKDNSTQLFDLSKDMKNLEEFSKKLINLELLINDDRAKKPFNQNINKNENKKNNKPKLLIMTKEFSIQLPQPTKLDLFNDLISGINEKCFSFKDENFIEKYKNNSINKDDKDQDKDKNKNNNQNRNTINIDNNIDNKNLDQNLIDKINNESDRCVACLLGCNVSKRGYSPMRYNPYEKNVLRIDDSGDLLDRYNELRENVIKEKEIQEKKEKNNIQKIPKSRDSSKNNTQNNSRRNSKSNKIKKKIWK